VVRCGVWKVEEAEAKADEAERAAAERITTFEAQVRQPAVIEDENASTRTPNLSTELCGGDGLYV
jgi:hypothetical protein